MRCIGTTARRPELLVHHGEHVVLREVPVLLHEPANRRNFPRGQRHLGRTELVSEPGQIEPHLRIAQILRLEFPPLQTTGEQAGVPGMGKDLAVPVGFEEGAEEFVALALGVSDSAGLGVGSSARSVPPLK